MDRLPLSVRADVTVLLTSQSGVVARRQLYELGVAPHDVRRLLRRRELSTLLPGVLMAHTGTPTWIQQAWAALLYYWPAALTGDAALRAAERKDFASTVPVVIDVAVAHSRRVAPRAEIRVERTRFFDERAQWNTSPPRLRYDEVVVDRAVAARDEVDAVAVLAQACSSRRTTPERLLAVLEGRRRVRGRRWLQTVLRDIANGTHSALEHGYLVRVERPHGLPTARRQLVGSNSEGTIYRDVDHGLIVVELDGRTYHGSPEQHDADLERDLDVHVEGRRTVRLGWGQVFRRACRTALKVSRVLQHAGWDDAPYGCGDPGCAVGSPAATR